MTAAPNNLSSPAGHLMTAREALDLIDRMARPVTGTEDVPLDLATGRILACDVVSTMDVPPHANAAVDGYAFIHRDLGTAGETALEVTARVTAGEHLSRPARHGEAIRIFTGAAMPEGCDTVAMQENVRVDGNTVYLDCRTRHGANRREAGEDIASGSVILKAGSRLGAFDIGLAASIGRTVLPCRKRLTVALFSTGNEVVDPGDTLGPGAIFDANRHATRVLLEAIGCQVTDLGILGDNGPQTRNALLDAAGCHHALVTSGGVSVGDEDHVQKTIRELGTLRAWYMAIKPGRPLVLGDIGEATFIGLPGNPAAAMVTFLRFARPLLLRLGGACDVEPKTFQVRSTFGRDKKGGRREYVRIHLDRNAEGIFEARAYAREGAGLLSSLALTDGLAELPEDMTRLDVGDSVEVLPFSEVLA